MLIGAGALLLAVPVVDSIRAHRVAARDVSRVEQAGPVLSRRVACAAGSRVRDVIAESPDGHRSTLGRTDADGAIVVDLDRALPADWLLPGDAEVVLRSEEKELGRASFRPVRAARAEVAWRAVAASACSTGIEADACEPEERYVARYPDGEHADESRRAIGAAAVRRRLAKDEETWSALDAHACNRATPSGADALVAACAPISKYLDEFPDGRHAAAARDALRSAESAYRRSPRDDGDRPPQVASPATSGAFIPYEGNGGGPTLCSDGMYSHSSGRGTCSHHGGVAGGASHSASHGGRPSSGGWHPPREHASGGAHHSSRGPSHR